MGTNVKGKKNGRTTHVSIFTRDEKPRPLLTGSTEHKCPFCLHSEELHQFEYHIEIHSPFKHKEFTIYKCGLQSCRKTPHNRENREKDSHFHCPYCPNTIIRREQFGIHVRKHESCETAAQPATTSQSLEKETSENYGCQKEQGLTPLLGDSGISTGEKVKEKEDTALQEARRTIENQRGEIANLKKWADTLKEYIHCFWEQLEELRNEKEEKMVKFSRVIQASGQMKEESEEGDSEAEPSEDKKIKLGEIVSEDAMRKAGTAHNKSSNDMENHVYVKAKSREEYLSLVARLIIHFRDIHKKALGGPDPMNALTNLTGVGGGPGAIGMGPRPTGAPVGGIGAMGPMQIGQHAMAGVAGNPQAIGGPGQMPMQQIVQQQQQQQQFNQFQQAQQQNAIQQQQNAAIQQQFQVQQQQLRVQQLQQQQQQHHQNQQLQQQHQNQQQQAQSQQQQNQVHNNSNTIMNRSYR
uniref:Mediator of RNA polymerase II transcription subunit 15 n=2 Tax=Mastacembelus armatus TaxID=205130 RepID=A0A7N8XDP9_9TELE